MNPMKLNEPQGRSMQPVFMLNGIVYLPDYKKPNYWRGPGMNKDSVPYTTYELMAQGAAMGERMLWPREWTEKIWTIPNRI
jgi:hypothetical protein